MAQGFFDVHVLTQQILRHPTLCKLKKVACYIVGLNNVTAVAKRHVMVMAIRGFSTVQHRQPASNGFKNTAAHQSQYQDLKCSCLLGGDAYYVHMFDPNGEESFSHFKVPSPQVLQLTTAFVANHASWHKY